ncbi:MAG: hypothetical protein ACXVCO_21490, partial [Ktedonobacterales bacterium]
MSFRRLHRLSAFQRVALFVVALAALAAGGSLALALARSKPPMSRISSHPARMTTNRTARFTLSDSQKRVRFYCAMDKKKFGPCKTLKSYPRVSDGTHKFRVKAMDGSGRASDTASYSWIVDHPAPSTLITCPANAALLSAAGYGAGCFHHGGVCGSASDRVPVSSVTVSIRQNQTGKYWNGSSYGSRTERFLAASLSTL